MIRAEPDDFVRPPANTLAQIMLQCAKDDPSLVKRSRGHAKSLQVHGKRLPAVQHDAGSGLMLLSNSDQAARQHLEDLVSIAVASAERADDALQQANVTRKKVTRAFWACGSIAVVGTFLGAAGVVSSRPGVVADSRVTQIAGEVRSPGEQQLASRQLADMRSRVADESKAAASSKQTTEQTTTPARSDAAGSEAATAPQAVPVPPSPPIVTPSVSSVQHATYSTPWPQYTRSVQSTAYSSSWPQYPQAVQPTWSARRRQITVPRFVVVIQQNLRSLFR